jgi:iron complex outermembrane receptor protein
MSQISRRSRRRAGCSSSWLALTASIIAVAAGSQALAADDGGQTTGAGAEGQDIAGVVVTAEPNKAAEMAPSKGSLDETQPEAIITHQFIEEVTPETGGWTTVLTIAPSMAGITSNGGGVGDYNVVTMRGFQDGQFNITYDGIAFGDTNDPTHHGADYWPTSTIGAVVIDRGPGAAGDLGQANFGGAIHFFSPTVSDTFGVVQKLTYGSFNTEAAVTTINTGAIPELGGGKLLLNFDERASDGELTHSGGHEYNQMAKFILPIGSKAVLTLFAAHETTNFNFEDSEGPGETWQQVLDYGKNFSMTAIPTDEHYYGYNYEKKGTDFEYIDLKDQLTKSLTLEDQAYSYYYSNVTVSSNDLTGLVGGVNTSPPMAAGADQSDIGGYDKLNEYRVWGDVVRLNQELPFGTLKVGGLVETSVTERENCFVDLTTGALDDKFTPPKYPFTTNCKLLEHSNWLQGQFFADFNWRPTDNLTISPGFKYVDFTRNVNAADENVSGAATKNTALVASNTYTSPLYFLTANYKLRPDWSVYAQFATSFLTPSLSALYVAGVNLQDLKPETTTNYQAGTVFTHGPITADADVYLIDATNLQVSCAVPDPTTGNPAATTAAFCNAGKARYDGVEGEAAYAFDFGLSLFANGSLNHAEQLANAADPGAGITANPQQELANAPSWTGAIGAIFTHGPWQWSLTDKRVGSFVEYNTVSATQYTFKLPGYNSFDGAVAYDFGRFKLKLQVFNILDRRAISSFTPAGDTTALRQTTDAGGVPDTSIYTFQAGRQIEGTLIAKF